jgi:REase_AHJR-like
MTLEQLQLAKLNQVAAEYRANGYEVSIHPFGDGIPPFLAEDVPDMIATSGDDRVIIEVKASPEVESDRTVRIAEAVAANPPWRFELVTANPSAAADVPAFGELVPIERVKELFANVELLLEQQHLEAAALVAWGAIEAILRRHANVAGLDLERQSSSRLLTELYGLGEIDPLLYGRLLQLMEFRNAVAHGFRPRVPPPNIAEIVSEAGKLQPAA